MIIIRFAFALAVSFCAIFASFAAASSEVGRYQLFQGEYEFRNIDGESSFYKALFKIDTLTGVLYICNQVQIPGKAIGKGGYAYQIRGCEEFNDEMDISLFVKQKKESTPR